MDKILGEYPNSIEPFSRAESHATQIKRRVFGMHSALGYLEPNFWHLEMPRQMIEHFIKRGLDFTSSLRVVEHGQSLTDRLRRDHEVKRSTQEPSLLLYVSYQQRNIYWWAAKFRIVMSPSSSCGIQFLKSATENLAPTLLRKGTRTCLLNTDDVRTLRTLAKQKTDVAKIAKQLKRTAGATAAKAHILQISLDTRG
jgi:hypothetical protein